MNLKRKREIRKLFGAHLKRHRETVLKIPSVRQLSFYSNLDQSKLTKVEKGQIDVRFDTLIELALTYKLTLTELLDFNIDFWFQDAEW